MRRLILDTGAIFATVNRVDVNYAVAARFFTEWLKGGGAAIITDSVFSESMTLIKARMGASTAIETGSKLRNSALYQWTPLTPDDESETWAVFQKYVDKEWSFVDCGLFVLARRLAQPIFSFDHHFEQMPEIKRVP